MVVQYNWQELESISSLPESKVLILFGLYTGTIKPVSRNFELLKKKLHINLIPNRLLETKILVAYPSGIFFNYRTLEPQTYIKNCFFLHMRFPARIKAEYLYILSQRPIGNNLNRIPDYYIEPHLYTNPLITRHKGYITFPLEKNYGKRLDTTKKTTITRKL
jgi:hypothetical protein